MLGECKRETSRHRHHALGGWDFNVPSPTAETKGLPLSPRCTPAKDVVQRRIAAATYGRSDAEAIALRTARRWFTRPSTVGGKRSTALSSSARPSSREAPSDRNETLSLQGGHTTDTSGAAKLQLTQRSVLFTLIIACFFLLWNLNFTMSSTG